MGKFFNVTVPIAIAGDKQDDGAFAAGDLIADWTAFNIPKGGAVLRGVTAVINGKDGASQAAGDLTILFANPKSSGDAPGTLGTVHAAALGVNCRRDVVAALNIDLLSDVVRPSNFNVMTTGGGGGADQIPFIGLEGLPGLSDNGFNTVYLALTTGAGNAALDFSTGVFQAVEDADELLTIKVDDGTEPTGATANAEKKFDIGDTLTTSTGDYGTIASIDATFADNGQSITFEALPTEGFVVPEDQEWFVKHPIKLVLSFEI
jgi:hypothetical protein